jgi:periplasmic copper chaperone A
MKRTQLLIGSLLLAACGQSEKPLIELSNAWARPTTGSAPAAVYLTIDNKGSSADRLTGVFSDHAALAMIHQNEVQDGVARMRMAGDINLPANDRIELEPGGTHIMLEGLRAPLKTGARFELVLKFRDAGDRTVEVSVTGPEGR